MSHIKKITAIALFTLTLTGLGCSRGSEQATEPVELSIWGVFDDEDNYGEVMESYRALHPNVSLSFREFRYEEYKEALIRAFAEGDGPDIFLLHNDWVKEYQSLIVPLPDALTISYQEVKGAIKKDVVNVVRTEPTISMRAFNDRFIDIVEEDAILPYQPNEDKDAVNKVFALPLAMDTMALYWNKDLLNAAGIASAPTTWNAFQDAVMKLTKTDDLGRIVQSGAAMGTSDNVERSADLLALLMMQNGTQMADANGEATFDKLPADQTGNLPGLDAVRFYTDFANPTKAVYTWNADEPNSFDAFAKGTTAMFFGYAYHLPLIKTAAPKLNFAISAVPQIDGGRQVNFGNYWMATVSKDSEHVNYAWDFVQFLTTDAEQNVKYLGAARKPPALRSLIAGQLEDEELSAFASQVLTAKSWYRGKDVITAEAALRELIDNILGGSVDPTQAIHRAVSQVNQTL